MSFDIPLIRVGDGTTPEGIPACEPSRSRWMYVEARMNGLCPAELERQVQVIRASASLTRRLDQVPDVALPPCKAEVPEVDDPSRFIDAAERIGRMLLRSAIRTDNGFVWITCRPVNSSRTWRMEPADFGLYDGSMGTGLFFAALYACTNDSYWKRATSAALRPVLDAIYYGGDSMPFANRFGVGGAEGLGGILYGLMLAYRLTGRQRYVDACLGAIRRIDIRMVGNDPDLLYGASGLVAGATAVYDFTGEPWVIDWANRNGRRIAIPSLLPTKLAIKHCPDGGFAHGSAGTAAVLGNLWLRSGDELCGASAIRFRALREAVPGNEGEAESARSLSWCHGAVGHLASEWGCEPVCAAMNVQGHRESVARLLSRVGSPAITTGESSLCCGLAGHLDLTLEAVRRRTRTSVDAHRAAAITASLLLERFESGHLGGRLNDRDVWPFSAGLYIGMAGVGYALLRKAKPDLIPSPLLWHIEDGSYDCTDIHN